MSNFKELKNCRFETKQLKGNGILTYCLFLDTDTKLYIKIIDNTEGGEFSKNYFLASLATLDKKNNEKEIECLLCYTDDGVEELIACKNTPGFIKAILKDLEIINP